MVEIECARRMLHLFSETTKNTLNQREENQEKNMDNTSIEDKILKQVEFYFSDSNLPRDKFLRSIVANDERGYVPIETISNFKRMKQITEDIATIVSALKKSEMLQVDETEKLVRRVTPLPMEDILDRRSIYVKGLPKDSSTIDSISNFFEKFGKVLSVRMRRFPGSKDFKGSAFIEFETPKMAQEIAAMKDLKYEENSERPLEVKMKKEWEEEKKKQKEERRKKKAESNEKAQPSDKKMEQIKQNLKYVPGTLLKISNIGTEEEMTFEGLKEELKKYGGDAVAYVHFPLKDADNNNMAVVRFGDANVAKEVAEKLSSEKKKFGGKECHFEILSSSEEEKFYLDAAIDRATKKSAKGKGGAKGKGKGGKGRGGKAKGGKKRKKESEGNEEHQSKVQRQE